jgi:hypothetical protein
MASVIDRKPVKGGWVSRDGATGRLIEVGTENGTFRSTPRSEEAARSASARRSSALQRLADR